VVQSSTHWEGGSTVLIRTVVGPNKREVEVEVAESSMGRWKAAGTAALEEVANAHGWRHGCGAFPAGDRKGVGAAG
jgi:hypothetical protein